MNYGKIHSISIGYERNKDIHNTGNTARQSTHTLCPKYNQLYTTINNSYGYVFSCENQVFHESTWRLVLKTLKFLGVHITYCNIPYNLAKQGRQITKQKTAPLSFFLYPLSLSLSLSLPLCLARQCPKPSRRPGSWRSPGSS